MAAPPKKTKKMRISVALKADDLANLEAMAAEQERSVSWLAGHAIHVFLTGKVEHATDPVRIDDLSNDA